MQILLNEKNEIISYAVVGGIEGGTTAEIPDEVLGDNPLSYRFENGSFAKNTEWIPPEKPISELEELQLAVAELAEIIAGGAV